jgi:peptidoglycan hydrolase-like protein with peptidoglycan-binding domain
MSANGQLAASELAPITGGGHLRKDAALAWNGFAKYCLAVHGAHVAVNDSYRVLGHPGDYARGIWSQWAAWERYKAGGNLSAVPGSSNHGWGLAVDVPPATQDLIHKYGDGFGFNKAKSDAPTENWHFRWDGYIRPDLKLRWCSSSTGAPVLHPGYRGPAAITLKKRLRAWGYFPLAMRIDNNYAGKIVPMVQSFQSHHGLAPDGVVGPTTWHELNKVPPPGPKPIVKPKPKPPVPAPKPKPVPVTPPKPKPVPKSKYFADVYEGDQFNASQYKAGNYPLIVLKASEGATYKDQAFNARFRDAGHIGLTRFIYHFARPGNGNTPIAEAQNFVAAINGAGKLNPDDRLVLDWEDPKFENKNGDKWIADFCHEVGKLGHTVRVLYSGGWYLPGTVTKWPVDHTGKALKYWHSAYTADPSSNVPPMAKPNLWACQYTDGTVGTLEPKQARGIGHCDMSFLV